MPEPHRVLILGGYGSTGRCLARLLLAHCDVEVTVAGRDENRAADLACQLGSGCRFARLDARDARQLHQMMPRHSLVVLAAPGADLSAMVVEAAFDCGADVIDVVYAPAKLNGLRALADRAQSEGRCVVTEAGFDPGLPSLLVRWAAQQAGRAELRSVEVASVIRPWIAPDAVMSDSTSELVDAVVNSTCSQYVDGQWQTSSWWSPAWRKFDFGGRWGQQWCVPLDFEEMHAVAEATPHIGDLCFEMAGFGPVTDWLAVPAVCAMQRLAPQASRRLCARMLWQSLKQFTPKPHGSVLAVRYRASDGRTGFLALEHANEYMLTAISLAAFVMQWTDGTARRPGLHYMGMLADPARLIADMQTLGVASRTV